MPSSSRRSILQDCPAVYTDCGVCQCVPGDVCQRCPNVIALSIPAENGTDFDMSSEPAANNSEPQENGQPPHYPSEADALSCSFMLLFFFPIFLHFMITISESFTVVAGADLGCRWSCKVCELGALPVHISLFGCHQMDWPWRKTQSHVWRHFDP